MGIVRSRLHKRKVTGGKRKIHRKRRKHELGRLPSNTKLGAPKVSTVRVRGGHTKLRALHLDTGNFAWPTEGVACRTRILDVVYNATSNELVRTKALVKNCIVTVDAAPFKQWYAKHYGISYDAAKSAKKDKSKKAKKETTKAAEKVSAAQKRKWAHLQKSLKIEKAVEDQLKLGRLVARLTSRPGQNGRADGVLLEGAELQFYQKKFEKKGKK
jgi:small subunit ribosomal protein S8e